MKQEQTTRAEPVEAVSGREIAHPKPVSAQMQLDEDDLVRFFNQSPDLLCIAGLDGYFKRLNPAWTSRLGWSIAELEASPFLDFVHPDDRAATVAQVDKLSRGAEVILFENRYRDRDGGYRWLRWNARPVPEREQIYASARDVTRQKRLEREILEIADREKERLGRELHDGLCQTLAGIAALSSTLSIELARRSTSAASAAAREISELLNAAIGEAHSLARGFGPLSRGEGSLEATLETLAINVHQRFNVPCTLEYAHPLRGLSREVETQLYRIAQEAVSNAVTHAHARRIKILLDAKAGEALLSIRDDGVGIPETVGTADGAGMHTMAYRARLIGGLLQVRRRTPRGTLVSCAFPLVEVASHDGANN